MAEDKNGRKTHSAYETEIDVMAVDQQRRHYLFGECKYKTAQFDLADYKALEAKWNSTDNTECCFYLFSQSGFTDAVNNLVTEGKAVCVSMEQMVDEFSGEIL